MGASAGPKRARGDVDRVPQGVLKLRFGSILQTVVLISTTVNSRLDTCLGSVGSQLATQDALPLKQKPSS